MTKVMPVASVVFVAFVVTFCFEYFVRNTTYKINESNKIIRPASYVGGKNGHLEVQKQSQNEEERNKHNNHSPPFTRNIFQESSIPLNIHVEEWETANSFTPSSPSLDMALQNSSMKKQKIVSGPGPDYLNVRRKLGVEKTFVRTRENQNSLSAVESEIKSPVPRNWRNLPNELYQLAPFVFDAVPKKFFPKFKNPCWYAANQQLTCLPYFYLLGFPKCGTTDLWDKINSHPQVSKTRVKEVHFWRDYSIRNLPTFFQYYLDNARLLTRRLLSGDTDSVYGDGSASNSHTHCRFGENATNGVYTKVDIIREITPNAKMIFIVRDPVERLYSGFIYFSNGRTYSVSAENFHKEALTYLANYKNCLHRSSELTCLCEKRPQDGRSKRLVAGIYAPFIKAWIDGFGLNQVLVIRLEDWMVGCTSILPKIYEFLELKPLRSTAITMVCNRRVKNQSNRSFVGPMLTQTRSLLEQFYAPFNQQLSNVLNYSTYAYS